jgi:hypothetical protein
VVVEKTPFILRNRGLSVGAEAQRSPVEASTADQVVMSLPSPGRDVSTTILNCASRRCKSYSQVLEGRNSEIGS